MKATFGAGSSSPTPPARVANVEKRRRRRVRDCGMKLTMDGKLSRKEVRKRRERREGEKAKKVAKREMRKGVNWKEFSANGGRQRGREGEAATFN